MDVKNNLQHKVALSRNKKKMAIRDEDFESVVREHARMLYRIAFNFFLSPSIAEEIVQDVFLQCFANRKNIASSGHLKSWLRRAATHRCIDVLRTEKARKEVQVDELPDLPSPILESDPLLSERLRRLVASLPEQQRMIVILRYGEEMNSDEIGELIDIPASTVRSNLHRALAKLRERLPRILGEEFYGAIRKQSS